MADLVALLRSYMERMLREAGPGMKALLLDAETTRVVSTVFSQSELLEQEVFLVERLEADRGDQLFHLKVRKQVAAEGAARLRRSAAQLPGGSAGGVQVPAPPPAARTGCLLPAAHTRERGAHPP